MKSVTDANLRSSIAQSDKPLVIVDYWAPWCAPCVQLGRLLESLDTENSAVEVLKINIDDNPEAGAGKTSVPVLEFYLDGVLVSEKVGLLSRRQLIQIVDGYTVSKVE